MFDERNVEPGSVQEIRRLCGYVIQRGGLFPHLTTRQNVNLLAKSLGWSDQKCEIRLVELLEIVQLEASKLGSFPGELSGGQRQRVSLMRALMLDPDVLLLDEPLGALDPLIRTDLQRDLKNIFAELGKTVIMVTHDLSEAAFFGDEIVLMRGGRIVQRGSYRELRDRPADAFVTRFIEAQTERITGLLDGGVS
jgi:osmoprotectant transport system ATP-binding protein